MIPQNCIVAEPYGDCWRACIATIVGEPIADVPNFMHLSGEVKPTADEGLELTRQWLAPRGLGLFETYCSANWTLAELLKTFSQPNPGVPIIICGYSVTDPDDGHAVIAMDGVVIHDPSGAGLSGPYPCRQPGCECGVSWWWIYAVSVTDRFNELGGRK